MEIPSIRRGSLRIASNKLTLQRSFFKLPTPFGTFDNGLQEYQVKKVVNVSPSKMFEIKSLFLLLRTPTLAVKMPWGFLRLLVYELGGNNLMKSFNVNFVANGMSWLLLNL